MNQFSPADVVTIGESMVLFQPLSEGSLAYAPMFMRSLAGAESNVAIGLTRMGVKVRWISRLGVDPFGDYIMSTLAGEGIDVSFVHRDPAAPTAVYFKEFKGYGDPNVYYYRKFSAASLLSPDEVKLEWFAGARHLHVTGITPALGPESADAIRTAMRLARSLGLSVSFDPNLRRKLWNEDQAREVLLSLIPLCDIFMPGIEEAEFLMGIHSEAEYGSLFLEMGVKVVTLKLGEQGSMGFCENLTVRADPFVVTRVIDTVGAGDAFAAGFLSAFLEGEQPLNPFFLQRNLLASLERANILGAMATQFKGDWEGIPTLAELNNLQSGKQNVRR